MTTATIAFGTKCLFSPASTIRLGRGFLGSGPFFSSGYEQIDEKGGRDIQ